MSPRPELFESLILAPCRHIYPFSNSPYQGGVPSAPAPSHPFQRPCFKGRSLVLRSLCLGAYALGAHNTTYRKCVTLRVQNLSPPTFTRQCSLLLSHRNLIRHGTSFNSPYKQIPLRPHQPHPQPPDADELSVSSCGRCDLRL
jgi:hypothetical protein